MEPLLCCACARVACFSWGFAWRLPAFELVAASEAIYLRSWIKHDRHPFQNSILSYRDFFFFCKSLPAFPLSDFQVNHPSSTWKGSVYLLSRCGGVITFEAVEPSLRDTQDILNWLLPNPNSSGNEAKYLDFFSFLGPRHIILLINYLFCTSSISQKDSNRNRFIIKNYAIHQK